MKKEIETFVSMWEPPLYIWSLKAVSLEEEDSGDEKFKSQLQEAEVETIEVFKNTRILARSTTANTIEKYLTVAKKLAKKTTMESKTKALGAFVRDLGSLKETSVALHAQVLNIKLLTIMYYL